MGLEALVAGVELILASLGLLSFSWPECSTFNAKLVVGNHAASALPAMKHDFDPSTAPAKFVFDGHGTTTETSAEVKGFI